MAWDTLGCGKLQCALDKFAWIHIHLLLGLYQKKSLPGSIDIMQQDIIVPLHRASNTRIMLSNKPSVGKPIVVAGVINLDIIPDMVGVAGEFKDLIYPGKMIQVGRAILATGGAVSNVGLALCRLGFPVRLIGKVGDDDFGKIILSLIQGQSPNLVEGMIIARTAARAG